MLATMRGLALVALLAGCTGTTVEQSGVDSFCEVLCACGLLDGLSGVTPATCPTQCANAVGAQVIPDACLSCVYEYEHECGLITQVCDSACQTQQATPLLERVEEGGS